ncbi:MAG: serine protease [Chlamydiales bacterium]|nr:serine protease [Chlamydiia bacterium]MCP5507307.1 serine protease [Chlamydiales bacterium]
MVALIILAVAFLAIFFEFHLPGGILGTIGAILLVASVVVFAVETDSLIATLVYIIVAGILLVLLVKFALWRIKNSSEEYGIYSGKDQQGYLASEWDRSLVDKEGIVSTDLRPAGHIKIAGRLYSAISQSGYVSKGETVVVIGGEGETLFVRLKG